MKINLKEYMNERERSSETLKAEGPVITFSREYGCEANRLAQMLIHRISELPSGPIKKHPWKLISKEIVDESAQELGLKSQEVERRVLTHHSDVVNDLFSSFSHHYSVSDKVILDKVKEVIMTYALKGNVMVIGRGGSLVTQGMKNVLRIRLMAPLEWRAASIAGKREISFKDALDLVRHFDSNRTHWMEHLTDKVFSESIFDLILNVKTLTDKEMIDMVLRLMEQRGMVFSSIGKQEKDLLKV